MFLHARGVRFESVTLRGKEVAEPRCEINRAQQWRKIVSRAIEAIEAEMNFETRILKLNVPQETALESVGLELRIGRCSAKSRDKAIDVTDRTDRYAFSVDAIVDATRLRARAQEREEAAAEKRTMSKSVGEIANLQREVQSEEREREREGRLDSAHPRRKRERVKGNGSASLLAATRHRNGEG